MNVIATLVSMPLAVWTVAVGVLLIYWIMVLGGLVDLGDADGGVDAAVGGMKGALEGGMKGATEALGGGGAEVDVGHAGADGHDVGDADGDAGEGGGIVGAILNGLHLKNVPVTITLSIIIFFSWALSLLALEAAGGIFPMWLRAVFCFVIAPICSLPAARFVGHPLSKVFHIRKAKTTRDLVGRTCLIRTGEVTETFGEATVKETGAEIVLRVRVEAGTKLARGEEGLIVGFDAERNEYIVEALEHDLKGKS
jgi:Protein of unknown function (DUF1449)